jgi:hypothetical protein
MTIGDEEILIAGKIDLQEGKEPKHSAVRMNRIQDA